MPWQHLQGHQLLGGPSKDQISKSQSLRLCQVTWATSDLHSQGLKSCGFFQCSGAREPQELCTNCPKREDALRTVLMAVMQMEWCFSPSQRWFGIYGICFMKCFFLMLICKAREYSERRLFGKSVRKACKHETSQIIGLPFLHKAFCSLQTFAVFRVRSMISS